MVEDLFNANFRIYGVGNFDINDLELSEILKILVEKIGKERIKSLKDIYVKLEKKRMG